MPEGPVALYLAVAIACLLFSAFFSCTEAALLSVRRARLQGMVERRARGARRVARMVEHPDRFLPTVLLGNNLVNTTAAALGTAIAINFIASADQAVIVATAAVTLLLLVFGEAIPKAIGAGHPERVSVLVVRPFEVIKKLLLPVSFLLQVLTQAVGRALGVSPWLQSVTEEELKVMIALGHAAGVVESHEAEMLERVFHFGDRQVREVITPRTEVVWVERGTTVEEFLSLYARYPYSRFPVYQDSVDNVTGILSLKDVVRAMAEGRLESADDATVLARPPLFVPETKPISDLLREFQASKLSMAIVVDEFGGVDGVVTLTQLLEVVVGRVEEMEGMLEEEQFRVLDAQTVEVDGGMRVAELNQRLELSLPAGDYETVAGYLLHLLGHIPHENEECEAAGVHLQVVEMKGVKIEKIQITRQASEVSAEPAPNGG